MNINKIGENARIIWIDYMRGIAIILVVLIHVTEMRISLKELNVVDRIFADFTEIIGRLGVPFFVLITGYLLLDRIYDIKNIIRFYKKNFFGLLIVTEIWFVILYLLLYLKDEYLFDATALINICTFQNFEPLMSFQHMWFMIMILKVYILIPFIAIIISKLPKKIFYVCLTIFTLYSFIPRTLIEFGYSNISDFFYMFKFNYDVFFAYVLWGYAIKKSSFNVLSNKIIYFVIATSLAFVFYVVYHTHHLGADGLFIFLIALFSFILIKKISIHKINNLILKISKYSFAIYLIHFPLQIFMFSVFNMPVINSFFIHVIVYLFMIIFFSCLIIKIINKSQFLSKYLLYVR